MRDDDFADVVRQVKEACDIVDIVGTYVSLRPAGGTFKGLCPFHDDNRPSFDVDPRRQRYRCWSCDKKGDVFSFIQEHDHVVFLEALELLAKRAGISMKNRAAGQQNSGRARMLDCVHWAATQFHECLLDSPLADGARRYLGERGLTGDTVHRFGLGYAPLVGDWLVQRAAKAGVPLDLLETVGLIAPRNEGSGYYDRFRDRVQFPIRDGRGQAVGFGGRVLPNSPLSARAPKYYNSADTPLFTKSEHLYGLDQARQAAVTAGYLAIVEGYTDVLMAHQHGIRQVVATMGTALNARHVQHLRRLVPRVVLVFDADAGGTTGVDRALELFVSHEVDLAVATLPTGLDPCDLLVKDGPAPFAAVLDGAVDVLEYKLNQVWAVEAVRGVEGRRRALEAVLGIIALAPELPASGRVVKQELIVNRITQRLGLKEETVWARLDELKNDAKAVRKRREATNNATPAAGTDGATAVAVEVQSVPRSGKASQVEKELLQVLLANPNLVPVVAAEVTPDELEHPGLRRLLTELYALQATGTEWTVDHVRARLGESKLADHALLMHDQGRISTDPTDWLDRILALLRQRRGLPVRQELQDRLHAVNDHETAVTLLRQLQTKP